MDPQRAGFFRAKFTSLHYNSTVAFKSPVREQGALLVFGVQTKHGQAGVGNQHAQHVRTFETDTHRYVGPADGNVGQGASADVDGHKKGKE